ncbi:AAA family ATPase [Oxalobacter vibrioformis]|uniref:AAA family ATPase n=1 Tax=Oxalobacter vibrioformis TaxID=933080 RepID=A0A9E9M1C7_9BURK|nr:bifunctional aminoglycoside phosphotransferase/ATP-binding protein [Oxalobacter vibrioformis]WAW10718.1 AAA family ATPase [Oxalobacter vibrioformis]
MMPFSMTENLKYQEELIHAWKETFRGIQPLPYPELIETHVSWVLLTKENAYKVKKALKLDFLDFSDLASRRFYCEEEIRLNKRTAPDIYQRVVSLGGSLSAPHINAEPVFEYAVEMKRFSRENEMAHMLEDGRLQALHIDSLAEKIAYFHESLPSITGGVAGMAYGTYDFLLHGLENNYSELGTIFSGSDLMPEREKLDALEALHFAVLEERKETIEKRHRDGFVRECHGDLHMGNIVFIDDEAILFDSIEFSPDFRCVDVICDLAFAFTDLHYFGRADYAWQLLNRYLEETGDYEGAALVDVFGASHALVRAKVAAIRYRQLTDDAQQAASLKESRRYMALAREMLEDRNAGLLITCGLPGAGKSVFSRAALGTIQAIRIRSDIERKRHYGFRSLQSSAGGKINIYSETASEITYGLLEKLADTLLDAGFRVIVDAAFLKKAERERFRHLAADRSVPFVIAMITASPETLLRRVTTRQMQRNDPSEAGPDVLAKKQAQFEPLSSEELSCTIEIVNEDGHDFMSDESGWKHLNQMLLAP